MFSSHYSSDEQLVAGHAGQLGVKVARHGVFDRHDVGQFGDTGADLGSHDVAIVGLVPDRHNDLHPFADTAVIFVEDVVDRFVEIEGRAGLCTMM